MKVATLICTFNGVVSGEVRTFDLSKEEGKETAIEAWKNEIKEAYESESEEEVLSKIEEGIMNDYSWEDNDGLNTFNLFWGETE